MEVILREHVDNVGRRGEIVKVADGFARNYLLPRNLALPVTPGNLKHIERERARFDVREAEERSGAEAIAARLAGLEVVISRKVGETEVLYGSVTAADIAESLAARKVDIDKRKIQLHDPIKRLGEYDVPVKLHRDVVTPIKVKVVAEGARTTPAKAED
jgi:large subunit ribosomal protein L9